MKKQNKQSNNQLMEKVVSLCKRRGFVFPSSEIYGGMANTWDYGPYGVELRNNIKERWWKKFVRERDDMIGLDSAIIMNPKVWEASGHLSEFSDPLIECKKCHNRFRADELGFPSSAKIKSEIKVFDLPPCSVCGSKDKWTAPYQFNLMFKTFIGPAEEMANLAYLRPETAQGIFVNFKNVLDSMRIKLPFGIAQIGKAFRNEITPGNFIFRTREFEQMEIEYFIEEKDWKKYFKMWREEMLDWIKDLGIDIKNKIYENEIREEERAHYSERTIDFEYQFPFGQKELYGLAYRSDYDLRQHSKFSGQDLSYTDPATGKKYFPHIIEPSLGVDRTILAVLCSTYCEENVPILSGVEKKNEIRAVLKLPKWLAPIKVAIFPLLKNKPELVKKAKEVFNDLKSEFMCEFDDNGNIGKRYRRQDEIGTPFCITVDFDSLKNKDATLRDRDTMKQERVKIKELNAYLKDKLK